MDLPDSMACMYVQLFEHARLRAVVLSLVLLHHLPVQLLHTTGSRAGGMCRATVLRCLLAGACDPERGSTESYTVLHKARSSNMPCVSNMYASVISSWCMMQLLSCTATVPNSAEHMRVAIVASYCCSHHVLHTGAAAQRDSGLPNHRIPGNHHQPSAVCPPLRIRSALPVWIQHRPVWDISRLPGHR